MTIRTALVVDDNEELAALVAQTLQREGFQMRPARNGLRGYSAYSREPTGWVVTDIQIAWLDGVEMMRCIRSVNPKVSAL